MVRCGAGLGLDWLSSEIERMPVDGQWQAVARAGLRDAAAKLQRSLSGRALLIGPAAVRTRGRQLADKPGRVADGMAAHLKDIRGTGNADFATLSVGVDALRRLAG